MIILKTPDEIAVMAKASRVVAEALAILKKAVKPGVTTDELDRLAESEIRARGAIPAFKGYRNYPKTLCASVNEQVVHGIPSKRVLEGGRHHRPRSWSDRRWILRRFGRNGWGRSDRREDGGAGSGNRRIAVARDQAGAGRQPVVGHFPCGPTTCGSRRLFGCDGVRRARHRAAVARRTAGAELREAGTGAPLASGDGLGDRADGEYGRLSRSGS